MPGRAEHPGKVSGGWVFKGTRLPVATVVENLEDLTIDEVIAQFDVTRDQVRAVLEFVVRACARPTSPPVLVLFDRGTPKGLARALPGHTVQTAQSRGWDTLDNGALLDAAGEPAGAPPRPGCSDGQHLSGGRFRLIPSSRRVEIRMGRTEAARRPFIGRWRITEMELWTSEDLDLVGPAYLTLEANGLGSMGFIAIEAGLDYRVAERDGHPAVEFSFDGSDEGDRISGRGWALLEDDQLRGRIFIHQGDDSGFTARRVERAPRRGKRTS